MRTILVLAALSVAACRGGHPPTTHHDHHHAPAVADVVGFVVAAPDRGFLGNEEVADAVAELAVTRNASVVFVTDERTAADLDDAIAEVTARGAARVVVLPLFLSAAEQRFEVLQRAVAAPREVAVALGAPFGASYLAAELVGDRLRAVDDLADRRLVIAGHGAADDAGRDAIAADLRRLVASAGFAADEVIVWRDGHDAPADDALAAAVTDDAVVLPVQLGPKLDSMMTFARHLERAAGVADGELTPDPLIALWMAQEANRHVPLTDDEIGVVMLAHGSDHHWNQGMRDAIAGVAARHDVEVAFSMADPPIVERAIRKLEARGARGIVVVRVFGLASSFRGAVEHMLGLDIEAGAHTAQHDHGHGHAVGPQPRIRSASRFATEGGLEASPRFAAALVDRARALSTDPSTETVILVAHGSGDDATNEHWRGVLGALADHMRADGGAAFRAIHVGTWREDWPGKREPEIAAIRALVADAARDGGRALVIPARTTAHGPEPELLEGLTYELGAGFAPHPEFEAWFEDQIAAGMARLRGESAHHH